MKIKLNLSEAFFLKLLLEVALKEDDTTEERQLTAQDILNKLNK